MTELEQVDFDPSRYTILIIDDNPTNLGVITDYLKEHRFTILNARDGEMGIKRALYTKPDIILLDVMMPVMDGFETCRRLKDNAATSAIPVIFMTALASTDDKVKGFEVGAVDYVTKPIQQAEVLARVTTHLRLRDLTRYLQQEHAREAARVQALTELNATKDRFFAIVAHDLRSPFNPLLGMTQMLLRTGRTADPDDIMEMAQSIYNSAESVYSLLENLLAWASAESGRMKYEPVHVDLHAVAAQTVSLLGAHAHNKRVTLQNEVAAETWALADPDMAFAIMRNLCSNALKFTPENGRVTLAARAGEAGMVEVSVSDTGVGIAPEAQAKLFILGSPHSTAGTAGERGTGLGLVICREMIEKHGGRIWIESVLGQGTTFKFSLPVG